MTTPEEIGAEIVAAFPEPLRSTPEIAALARSLAPRFAVLATMAEGIVRMAYMVGVPSVPNGIADAAEWQRVIDATVETIRAMARRS